MRLSLLACSRVDSARVSAIPPGAFLSHSSLRCWSKDTHILQVKPLFVNCKEETFVTWLLGHVFLALNMSSEHLPLFKLGPFSNCLMIIWGAATGIFVLLATLVPAVQTALRTVSLSSQQWALVVGASLVGMFWLEMRKVSSHEF